MRINNLSIDKSITQEKGLEEINLERLGSVVALIGKNGSGKSRILRLLLEKYAPTVNLEKFLYEFSNPPQEIEKDISQIKPLLTYLKFRYQYHNTNRLYQQNTQSNFLKERTIILNEKMISEQKQLGNNFASLIQRTLPLNQQIPTLIPKYFREIKSSEILSFQTQIAQQRDSTDSFTFEQLIETTTDPNVQNEFTTMHRSALNYLRTLPHKIVYQYIVKCKSDIQKFKQTIESKRFESLRKNINDFLGKNLEWEEDDKNITFSAESGFGGVKGKWKLGGRDFNWNEFSEGEKTLFAYALLFFLLDMNPKVKIKESIIFIDEPELYVYPKGHIDLIKGIRKVIGDTGQLWIATHSVHILSELNYEEIFMVKDGKITSPKVTTPENALDELVGYNHLEKLTDFVTSLSEWAYVNFIAQCFSNPDIIETAKANDPEVELFKKFLKETPNINLLLDFGAGKGRLYKEMINDESLKEKIKYSALDPLETNQADLQALGVSKLYKEHTQLSEKTFDSILMCGVLHEIQPVKWVETLNKIKSSLKEDGYLIIIEDKKLKKGEKPNEIGYLVLDIPHLKLLFDMKKDILVLKHHDKNYQDRILCAVIKKADMGEVSKDTIKNALKELQEFALKEVRRIKKVTPTPETKYALGREKGFYSELYMNAFFGIESLN